MKSLSPPAPVLRALLSSLLAGEYSLFMATRSAARSTGGHTRARLESQALTLGIQLERVAGQLGSWGEGTLVGRGEGIDQLDSTHASFSGRLSTGELAARHEALVGQLHRFAARTNRLGDDALNQLLPELAASHAQASAELLALDYPVAQAM